MAKTFSFIFAFLGSAGSIVLGGTWLSDYFENREKVQEVMQASKAYKIDVSKNLAELSQIRDAGYALVIAGFVALILPFLLRRLGGVTTGILLLGCAAIPAFFATKALVFSFPLILAGVCAFFSKPQMAPA